MTASVTDAEKATLSDQLGNTKSLLGCAVARLYLASPDPNVAAGTEDSVLATFPALSASAWTYTGVVGAVALIVDRALDTYMFQIYDLDTFELRFEYELYEDIDYRAGGGAGSAAEGGGARFHVFEMEDCVAGLSFADATEARWFLSKVNRFRPRAPPPGSRAHGATQKGATLAGARAHLRKHGSARNVHGNGGGGGGGGGKKKKKGRWRRLKGVLGFARSSKSRPRGVSQIEISGVTQVTHVSHVGIHEDGSFDLANIPTDWKALFKRAGIRKRDLRDAGTAMAVMAVMNEYGVGGQEKNVVQAPDGQYYEVDPEAEAAYQRELAAYEAQMAEYEAK